MSRIIDVHQLLTPQLLSRFPDATFRPLESRIDGAQGGSAGMSSSRYCRRISFVLPGYAQPFIEPDERK